jgi:predicted RNase H-like HicB family nuclease
VATGVTVREVKKNMKEAIELHIQGLKEDGLPIPRPSTEVVYIEVTV